MKNPQPSSFTRSAQAKCLDGFTLNTPRECVTALAAACTLMITPGLLPASETTAAQRILTGQGEIEIAVSTSGRNIVVAKNFGTAFSTNGGLTFSTSSGNVSASDPSVAFGASGAFYLASIASPGGSNATSISVSTDNGQNFTLRGFAVMCPSSGAGNCFPDQEHIAADAFNVGPTGGDQLYSVWRNFVGNSLNSIRITASTDGGNTWSASVPLGSGDFPRITVGRNGFVYVVYANGGTISINKYSSAASGLVLQPSFPRTVTGSFSETACPVPGLDRCPNGGSYAVAVDDTNPNHVYVAYILNTSAANEDVMVQDSVDGGVTWARPRVRVNTAIAARRYMPWVCSVGGAAHLTWYDRRAAAGSIDNSLTDFYRGSAQVDGSGNLAAGLEVLLSPRPDSACSSGWTSQAPIAMADSESCSLQPQLAGICCQVALDDNGRCPAGMGSANRCDFSDGGCPAGESCQVGPGAPKYGDYNGNACAAGRVFSAWTSATDPTNGLRTSLGVYFSSTIVCCVGQIQIPGDVVFADTCVGESSFATLNICNTGKGDLEIGPITSTNGQFTVVPPSSGYPVIISPDFCFPFRVRFTPTSRGDQATTFIVPSNDPVNPTNLVRGFGTGLGPTITALIADTGNFGDVCLGSFRDLNLTINNAGGCTLLITNITSTLSNEFLVPLVMNYPLVIHPGDSVGVPIRFRPMSLGSRSATIVIAGRDLPLKMVSVSGNVPSGDIRVTGSTDFGEVCFGPVAEKTISICNVGKCNLLVSNVSFVLPCPDFVLVNNPFPAVVSHDSCVDVVIRFTPSSCGSKSCMLRIVSDDPDTPVINLTVTASTPCSSIDVPPDVAFPPTVIRSFGPCQSLEPFPISNTGTCPLKITDIQIGGPQAADYSLIGLPSFPIILEPGHIVGAGDLNIAFAPAALARERRATITVTYESDPTTGAKMSVTRALCGEGVSTGARVLVMVGGLPIANVEKIQLGRINANRNKKPLDTQDVMQDAPLTTIVPALPCQPFQYHREYGTVSNPIQLLAGSYQVTVSAIVNGKRKSQSVGFDVSTCDFNPTIVINF